MSEELKITDAAAPESTEEKPVEATIASVDAEDEFSIEELLARTVPLVASKHAQRHKGILSDLGLMPGYASEQLATRVIRAAYYASMRSDEGRYPHVFLKHIDTTTIAKARSSAFNPPIPADAATIAKLAHVASEFGGLAFTEQEGRAVIVDVLPPSSGFPAPFISPKNQSPKRAPFVVVIRGPGNIDVVVGKRTITYNAGIVSEYRSLHSSRALERLSSQIDAQLAILLGAEFQAKIDNDIEIKLTRIKNPAFADLLRKSLRTKIAADSNSQSVISEIVRCVSDLRHGGIVIFTDRPDTPSLTYKYPAKAGRLRAAVLRYWKAAYEDGKDSSPVAHLHTPGSTLIQAGVVLGDCVSAIAQLAGTDGAIVLGRDFSLHGFGAIIDKADVDATRLKFIDGTEASISYESILKNKGSRHQSALSFVMREPGAVAFVVSQDGHITVIENHDGFIRVEKGLRADGE